MQVPAYLEGAIAPVFTAFNDDGTLDDAGQRHIMDALVDTGAVASMFIRSGMGQMYAFNVEDTKQLANNVVGYLKGKAHVLVGCSGEWDRNYEARPDRDTYIGQSIELAKYVDGIGADCAVLAIPEALVPNEGEAMGDMVYNYVKSVCDAVSCGVVLYQVPGIRPEYITSMETMVRLAKIDNLIGMKASNSDAAYIFDAVYATRDLDFGYIVGAETAWYAGLLAGSRGTIGQGCSVNPLVIKVAMERYDAGDLAGVVEAQQDINQLCYVSPNPVEFFKQQLIDAGKPLSLYARPAGNPYAPSGRAPMTREEYETFKAYFDNIMAKYQ